MVSLCNRYHVHAEVSVYESGQKATFVLIGNAGPELIGRHASELFDNYGEVTHTHLILHLPNNTN